PLPCCSTRRGGSVLRAETCADANADSRYRCVARTAEWLTPDMADPTLYLFDGHNLLHAGGFADPRELRDTLASFVALRGARGILVFDGVGQDEQRGPLEVRFAKNADSLIERLATENRTAEQVCVVSSDSTVRATAGRQVQTLTSQTFLRDMEPVEHDEERPSRLADRLDDETRAALERLRRGEG